MVDFLQVSYELYYAVVFRGRFAHICTCFGVPRQTVQVFA
jgi:hypothetical protein